MSKSQGPQELIALTSGYSFFVLNLDGNSICKVFANGVQNVTDQFTRLPHDLPTGCPRFIHNRSKHVILEVCQSSIVKDNVIKQFTAHVEAARIFIAPGVLADANQ